jgi:hypothetical protein
MVAILAAILRAHNRAELRSGRPDVAELDSDFAVMQAIAMVRDGLDDSAMAGMLDAITGGAPCAEEILHDVDYALAVRWSK